MAVAILAPACAGSGPIIRLADGQRASAHGEADVAGVSATIIEMDDFFFRPTVLHGTPGQRLTVTLSNQGNSLHDFRIAAQHIDANVEAGTPVLDLKPYTDDRLVPDLKESGWHADLIRKTGARRV